MNLSSLRNLTVFLVVSLSIVQAQMTGQARQRTQVRLNDHWQFQINGKKQEVTLPHTAHVEPLVLREMWMGDCQYQRNITLTPDDLQRNVYLRFEGAMQVAKVFLNGKLLTTHYGGYLPFMVKLNAAAKVGENTITVALNNQYNADIPPGKPFHKIDFAWYGGIYRNVDLIITDKLHITDAVTANKVAGGGIFFSTLEANQKKATVLVKTEVKNDYADKQELSVRATLVAEGDQVVSSQTSAPIAIAGQEASTIAQKLTIQHPRLWSPQSPHLYQLKVEVIQSGKVIDSRLLRVGVRRVSVTARGFVINGKTMFLRGTNRHQEYPYLGYALSDAAQYRDAEKIKAAGFDFVRLSHYPQSPAFLAACDELGIVVMDSIPGWQFFKKGAFAKRTQQNVRDMIRNDRNHASIIFWEASLNETYNVSDDYIRSLHQIVHAEYPGDQAFSAGWKDRHYDVFIPARQHRQGPKFWDDWKNGDKPLFTAEYGDWEYFGSRAANFNQTNAKNLKKAEVTSRQRRGDGEKRMLQQALNFQEAHNQNHVCSSAIGDANWLYNDYNRGSRPNHCESGVVDIFRLPKFVYYFYQSQRDVTESSTTFSAGPMVFAATYWDSKSPLDVRVFSNCDEVELVLNGKSLGRKQPDQNIFSNHLAHPPFTFKINAFEPGTLMAIGYIKGKPRAKHLVRTPEAPDHIEITMEKTSKPLVADGADSVFIYARLLDKNGTLVPINNLDVQFKVKGNAHFVFTDHIASEAGVSTMLLQSNKPGAAGEITLQAFAKGLKPGTLTIPTSAPIRK